MVCTTHYTAGIISSSYLFNLIHFIRRHRHRHRRRRRYRYRYRHHYRHRVCVWFLCFLSCPATQMASELSSDLINRVESTCGEI